MLMCQYVVVGADACIRPRVDASIDSYIRLKSSA